MAVAPLTPAQAQTSFDAYSKQVGSELFKLRTLETKLDDGNIEDITKNWRNYNEAFSERLTAGIAISENYDVCRADFSKLVPADQQKFIPALIKTADAFEKQASGLRSAILDKFLTHSIALGADQHPVRIQNSNAKGPGRALPPIEANDVEVRIEHGQVIIGVPVKQQKAQPYLITRLAKGLYKHSGKIAFVASAAIIASQTGMGATFLANSAGAVSQFVTNNYEPIKEVATTVLTNVASVAKNNLPAIGSVLSGIWALPTAVNAWRAGHKRAAVTIAATGAAFAIAPHAMQPGLTVKGVVDAGLKLATTVGAATGLMKTEL